MWGGGPLQKDIGELLHKEGVRMCNSYGTTEVGGISLVIGKGDCIESLNA